jgi:hypothetical protein
MGTVSAIRTYTLETFVAEVEHIRGQLRREALPLYIELGRAVVRASESGIKRSTIAEALDRGPSHVDKLLRVGRWTDEQCAKALAECDSWGEMDSFGRQRLGKYAERQTAKHARSNLVTRITTALSASAERDTALQGPAPPVEAVAEVVPRATVAPSNFESRVLELVEGWRCAEPGSDEEKEEALSLIKIFDETDSVLHELLGVNAADPDGVREAIKKLQDGQLYDDDRSHDAEAHEYQNLVSDALGGYEGSTEFHRTEDAVAEVKRLRALVAVDGDGVTIEDLTRERDAALDERDRATEGCDEVRRILLDGCEDNGISNVDLAKDAVSRREHMLETVEKTWDETPGIAETLARLVTHLVDELRRTKLTATDKLRRDHTPGYVRGQIEEIRRFCSYLGLDPRKMDMGVSGVSGMTLTERFTETEPQPDDRTLEDILSKYERAAEEKATE